MCFFHRSFASSAASWFARRRRGLSIAGTGTLLLTSFSPTVRAQTFTNIATQSGLQAVRDTRAADWWLSGLYFVDLDGDGHLDVYMSSHGSYGALAALNDGMGHFALATGQIPTTETHLAYDIDEDGKVDLAVTYSDGGGQWWTNGSTAGMLAFAASKVIRDGGLSRQQALIDINGDGKVDWLRGAGAGVLFDFGDGKGAFAEASRTLANPGTDGISVIPVDLDGDGDKDLIVEWGRYDYENGRTRIYRNDGKAAFTDVTVEVGLYEANLAIVGAGDFDQDGDTDLIGLETKALPHTIFLNDGTGHFARKPGAISGVKAGSANYASWGLATVTDLDNDGIADIIVDGRNYLHVLRGTGGGAFTYMNDTWGGIVDTAEASVDNGFTFGDIDHDGDLDLIGYKQIDPRYFNLYRNDLPAKNWINVRPVGLAGNKGAAGAKISIYAPGTKHLLWYEDVTIFCKQVQQNYYAYSETERHFGLGAATNVDVTVLFYPSNKLVRQDGVAANSTVRISEDGIGVIVPPPGGGTAPILDASSPGPDGSTTGAGGSSGMGGASGASAVGMSGASGSAGAPAATGSGGNGTVPAGSGSGGGCSCRTSLPRPIGLGPGAALGLLGLALRRVRRQKP